MKNSEQPFEWNELRDLWVNSSQTRNIHIQVADFLNEVKNKSSQFEKDAIDKDMEALKSSLKEFSGLISQFEKDSVEKDIKVVSVSLRKFLDLFRKGDQS